MSSISSVGSYSTSSLAAMKEQLFAKADANNSGGLTLEEFTASLPEAPTGASGAGAASASQMFSDMDTDGDGSVTSAEFASFTPPKPSGTAGLAQMGSGSDILELLNGLSSTEDSSSTSTTTASTSTDDASELFSALDTDGDGTLSETEFAALGAPPPGGPPPGPPPSGASSASTDETEDDTTVSSTTSTTTTSSTDLQAQLMKLIEQVLSNFNADTTGTSGLYSLEA